MDAAAGLSKSEHCWRGFKRGNWCNAIDVRDFIVSNATPYEGDESSSSSPPRAPRRCGTSFSPISRKSGRRACLPSTRSTPSTMLAHKPGYIDRANEVIVGLQTDEPFKRAIFPYGGLRMVEAGLKAAGFEADPQVHEAFTKYRKTHNDGVFDAYTPEIMNCRRSGIITGLPDAYGRGRIIGDYRRVALYGVDRLLEAKREERAQVNDMWPTDEVIRLREELAEQIRALEDLATMAKLYELRHLAAGGGRARSRAVDLSRLSRRHQGSERRGDVDRPHLELPRHLYRARPARGRAWTNPARRSSGTSSCRSCVSCASCARPNTTRCSAATPTGRPNASAAWTSTDARS